MGVTHGKKKDLQRFPARNEAHVDQPDLVTHQSRHSEQEDRLPGLNALSSELQCEEEESSDLIRPHRPVNPAAASRSHQELHKELQLTHKRRLSQEGKTELQRALEKRKWEQRMKASRDQEEAKKSTSPLHQELLKRHQRLENLEREEKKKQEEPEFLQVKERLRRTTSQETGENKV
ncbi:protein FAM107B-like [Salarias fasciatus]|uniref:protein FAM107B-like n=1 Tax=Salarias fasciatus TaxID=181472 RepID=UPI0011765296|nr:protein FAM107B-like [Salarias fasciatus]